MLDVRLSVYQKIEELGWHTELQYVRESSSLQAEFLKISTVKEPRELSERGEIDNIYDGSTTYSRDSSYQVGNALNRWWLSSSRSAVMPGSRLNTALRCCLAWIR